MQVAETKTKFVIYSLSERSLTVEFGMEISELLLFKVNALNADIRSNPFPGFITTIPAYASLTIVFDPLQVTLSSLAGTNCFEKVSNYLSDLKPSAKHISRDKNNVINIPVCYNEDLGTDLKEIARLHKLSIQDIINIHSAVTYTVYMVGFVPGFAYLGGMNDLLATPRKATPSKAVPAGSVGIAGQQTGIYPLQTPGGWQIIGQTPLKMFDTNRAQPSLLKAGDSVIFKPIDLDEFNDLKAGQ